MAIKKYSSDRFVCLSTDSKPTILVPDGALLHESDTLTGYLKVNGSWLNVTASGYATQSWVLAQSYIDITELTTTSGDIVDQIPSLAGYATQSWVSTNYIDNGEMTTISGDLVAQIPSLTGYATESWVSSQGFIDLTELTTTSGDIVSQIPSLAGYATESWVSTNYIDTTEITTISGDIVAQIPSLAGYATESWVSSQGFITLTELTTTSGDIIDQIPSLAGYATESWVSSGYIDNSEMTTISGDIIAQIGEGEVTLQQLTTTSGDIVSQIPSLAGYATESWTNTNFIDNSEMTTISGDIIAQLGEAGSQVTIGTAGETLSQYQILYLNTADAKWYKSVCNNTEIKAEVYGICTEAGGISADSTGEITLQGKITNAGWSWTVGTILYVSTTSGSLSQTKPDTVGQYARAAAIALDTDEIWFAPEAGYQVASGTGGGGDYATESWVATNYIDNLEMTTISGDLIDQIPSLVGYATESWVTSQDFIDLAELTTTSGDIVSQIPSLAGYATESWTNTNFIDTSEMTTISGDLVAQMGAGEVTQEQLTTTSGDIVSQIPSLTGYATESWVNSQGFIDLTELTTTSGDIVTQIPTMAEEISYYTGISVIADGSLNTSTDYATPIMTSDSAPYPNVSAASTVWDSSYAAWKAFERTVAAWHSASSGGEPPQWLRMDFGAIGTIVINKYRLRSRDLGSNRWFPRNWVIQGSNNASDWDTLDTRTNIDDPGQAQWSTYFTFTNSTEYRYYRIYVTVVNGGSSNVCIAEMHFIEAQYTAGPNVIDVDDDDVQSAIMALDTAFTTVSGEIVAQIPSLAGYATESWTNTNFINNSELTTASGDIITQIPSLTGYATESWTNTNFIDNSEMTTISGDIIDQIGEGGGWTEDHVTGTAGEALSQYDIVYSDSTDSGEWKKAYAADTKAKADAYGVVTEIGGISDTSTGEITLIGQITNDGWSFTPGSILYVSTSVSGGIVQSEPDSSQYYVKPIGTALTSDTMWFSPLLGYYSNFDTIYAPIIDVMGGRIQRDSDSQISWEFVDSNQVTLYNNSAGAWENVAISSAPTLTTTSLPTASGMYSVYLCYSSSTAATLEAAVWADVYTEPTYTTLAGRKVKGSGSDQEKRLVAIMFIDNSKYVKDEQQKRYIANYFHPELKEIGVDCPFSSNTTDALDSGDDWYPWYAADITKYKIECVSTGKTTPFMEAAGIYHDGENYGFYCAWATDDDAPDQDKATTVYYYYETGLVGYSKQLSAGYHYMYPLIRGDSTITMTYWSDTSQAVAAVTGHVFM